MKVPKEILKYLNYALGFCEERGLEEYEKIAEIIVENDLEKEFKFVHEELKEIRKSRKRKKRKKKEKPKIKDLGPCHILNIHPSIFIYFGMLFAEDKCRFYFKFLEQMELSRFHSLKNKNGEFKRIRIRPIHEKKGHMLIYKFIIKKVNKRRLEITVDALPGKKGTNWEMI